jgi:RNA polymerase sigma-70 factor (sigma-E family)
VTGYDDFVREQLPRLSRYAMMLAGNPESAADLVQDVLVKAHRHWARVERAERPDRYVMRMLTNQYLSWRTSWSARSVIFVSDVPERPDPFDAATDQALRDDMWQRLVRLPKRQRAVLVLRYYEQLSDAEIAQVLGCAPTTVRGYAHRAITALRADFSLEDLAHVREDR